MKSVVLFFSVLEVKSTTRIPQSVNLETVEGYFCK